MGLRRNPCNRWRSWRDLVAAMASASSALESLQALWFYVLRTAVGRPEPVIQVVDELMEAEFMSKRKTAAEYLLEEGASKAASNCCWRC